jgi:hypothetical protein
MCHIREQQLQIVRECDVRNACAMRADEKMNNNQFKEETLASKS